MACGSPVACSATSSLGEIAGDAAITFDPEDTAQIIDALRRVLKNPGTAEALRQKGLDRAAEFSWARAAKETWSVYDRVIAAHSHS
jgi:glycosyltransferase involved in cell wall biosynthesis